MALAPYFFVDYFGGTYGTRLIFLITVDERNDDPVRRWTYEFVFQIYGGSDRADIKGGPVR